MKRIENQTKLVNIVCQPNSDILLYGDNTGNGNFVLYKLAFNVNVVRTNSRLSSILGKKSVGLPIDGGDKQTAEWAGKRKMESELENFVVKLESVKSAQLLPFEATKQLHKGKVYLDVPSSDVQIFLETLKVSLENENHLTPTEWNQFRTVVCSGTFSIVSYPTLLQAILSQHRIDVLLSVAQYAPDLTEYQAVAFIKYVVNLSEESLNQYALQQDGTINYSVATSTETKSKKTKKGGKTASASEASTSSTDGPRPDALILLRSLIDALIARQFGSFNTDLLAAATKHLKSSLTCLLLRIFAILIRGLGSYNDDTEQEGNFSSHFVMSDNKMCRAVSWIEALLDCHFSEFSLKGESNTHIKNSLSRINLTLAHAEKAIDNVESALGMCTHLIRMQKCSSDGLVRSAAPTGMYQLEKVLI